MFLLKDLAIVAGQRSTLVREIAAYFGKKIIRANLEHFADSESIVEIANAPQVLNDKFVLIIHSFGCGSLNDQLMQVLLLAHQVKANRAKNIMLLLPYLPYGRQSRNVAGNLIGPLQAVGLFCKAAGVDHVASIELHEKLCESVFPIPLHDISLDTIWHRVIQENFSVVDQKNICFASPDRGGVDRVKRVANMCNTPWAFVEKKRIGTDQSKALTLVGDVKNKIVIMIDDIVDTGQTAINAAQMISEHGARELFGCFSHAVMSPEAIQRLAKSNFKRIWISNGISLNYSTLPDKISVVSIDELLIAFLDSFFQKVDVD